MRLLYTRIALTGILFLFTGLGAAQEAAPALTEVQRLRVQSAIQQVEIAQLHMQLAQAELQHAQSEAQALLGGLVVKGWQLNLQTLKYEPISKEPAK